MLSTRTHIFLQNLVLIQPRTSPPMFAKRQLFSQLDRLSEDKQRRLRTAVRHRRSDDPGADAPLRVLHAPSTAPGPPREPQRPGRPGLLPGARPGDLRADLQPEPPRADDALRAEPARHERAPARLHARPGLVQPGPLGREGRPEKASSVKIKWKIECSCK